MMSLIQYFLTRFICTFVHFILTFVKSLIHTHIHLFSFIHSYISINDHSCIYQMHSQSFIYSLVIHSCVQYMKLKYLHMILTLLY